MKLFRNLFRKKERKDTDIEVGKLIVETIKEKLDKIKVNFAVQCCEHLNRAIVIEKEVLHLSD